MTEQTQTPEQNALARPETAVAKLRTFLEGRSKHLEQWCRGRISPAALIRFALLDYAQQPKLQKCTPDSVYMALLACAQLGLEPGRLKQQAFIVPYGAEAQFQMGWRGYVALAYRQRIGLRGQVAYERDRTNIDLGGAEPIVQHFPDLGERGGILGAYAIAAKGTRLIDAEWMSLADLEKVKAHATRGGRATPAWTDWEEEMHRKAPVRRLGKRLPVGEEWAVATALEDADNANEFRATLSAVSEADIPEAAEQSSEGEARLDRALKQKR